MGGKFHFRFLSKAQHFKLFRFSIIYVGSSRQTDIRCLFYNCFRKIFSANGAFCHNLSIFSRCCLRHYFLRLVVFRTWVFFLPLCIELNVIFACMCRTPIINPFTIPSIFNQAVFTGRWRGTPSHEPISRAYRNTLRIHHPPFVIYKFASMKRNG